MAERTGAAARWREPESVTGRRRDRRGESTGSRAISKWLGEGRVDSGRGSAGLSWSCAVNSGGLSGLIGPCTLYIVGSGWKGSRTRTVNTWLAVRGCRDYLIGGVYGSLGPCCCCCALLERSRSPLASGGVGLVLLSPSRERWPGCRPLAVRSCAFPRCLRERSRAYRGPSPTSALTVANWNLQPFCHPCGLDTLRGATHLVA